MHLPSGWLSSQPKVDFQGPLFELGQSTKGGASKVDMLGAFGTSCTCVDDSNKDAFLRAVTD